MIGPIERKKLPAEIWRAPSYYELINYKGKEDDYSKEIGIFIGNYSPQINYDNYKNKYKKLAEAGMSEIMILAMKGNIKTFISPEIMEILEKYSPELAKQISNSGRVFEDSGNIQF